MGISCIVIYRFKTAWAAFVLRTWLMRGFGVTIITADVSINLAVEFGRDFSAVYATYETTFPWLSMLSSTIVISFVFINEVLVGSSVQ